MRADATTFFPPPAQLARAPRWDWMIALLLLVPLINGLLMSISHDGREAFAFWWRDARGWNIFARSLAFAALGAGVATMAGVAIAMLLSMRSINLSRIVVVICCLPLLVPSSLMGVGWIMALGRDAVVTNLLRHVLGEWTPTIYNWPMAAGATGLRYFGVAALVVFAARNAGGNSSAAERVFALSWSTRLRLHLGALKRPIIAAYIVVLLLVQSDHILPGMFLVHTFGTEILIQFNAQMNPSGAAALASVPAAFSLVLAVGAARLLRDGQWFQSAPQNETTQRLLGSWALGTLILLIAVGMPLCGIAVRAGSAANCVSAWQQSRDEAFNSLRLAGIGGLMAVIPAAILAHAWSYRRRLNDWLSIVLINIAVPGSLLALGLLSLPWPRRLLDSDMPLLCAYAVRFTPIAMIVMAIAWSRIAQSVDLAGRVHGVPWLTRMRRLIVPTRAPAFIAAYALAVLLIAAELEMSLILVQPGPTTLGVRLYSLIHTAPDHIVAALAMDVLVIVVIAVACMEVALTVRNRTRGGR